MKVLKNKGVYAVCMGVMAALLGGCSGSGTPTEYTLSGDNMVNNGTVTDPTIKLFTFQKAEIVIGQPDFNTTEWADTDPDVNNFSTGMYSNPIVVNERLYIADYGWNRVMGFDTIPSLNGTDADFVLGQDNFYSQVEGDGNDTMSGPQTMATTNGKFFVVEYSNHQVLVYNSVPTAIGDKPDYVIGQENFGDNNTSCTDNRLDSPESIYAVNGKLLISDSDHNRVLIYNTIPNESNASADLVLGQASFTECNANRGNGLPSADTLLYPAGIWTDGERLVVNDIGNNRVLIWNTFPTSNGQPADIVLGQNDFNMSKCNDDDQDGSNDGQPSSRTLCNPYNGVDSNGVQLFVTDAGNNRVLIWNEFPTANFEAADVVLGQSDFNMSAPNDDDQDGSEDDQPSARTLNYPNGVYQYGDRLFVNDQDNGRVLIFKGEQ